MDRYIQFQSDAGRETAGDRQFPASWDETACRCKFQEHVETGLVLQVDGVQCREDPPCRCQNPRHRVSARCGHGDPVIKPSPSRTPPAGPALPPLRRPSCQPGPSISNASCSSFLSDSSIARARSWSGAGYRSYHPDFALPTRVSCVLEGEATRRFEPSTVVASPVILSRVQTCPGSDRSRSSRGPGPRPLPRGPRAERSWTCPRPRNPTAARVQSTSDHRRG